MDDCIFCKIANGQIKAALVLESERVVAFRDINPQAPVHILIIPRKHIERISSLEETDYPLLEDLHRAAKKLAQSENLLPGGFRLLTNDGKNAGQTVSHLHYHLLGGRKMGWPPG